MFSWAMNIADNQQSKYVTELGYQLSTRLQMVEDTVKKQDEYTKRLGPLKAAALQPPYEAGGAIIA